MSNMHVDPDLCIGCGLCVELCPTVFEMRENKAWLIKPKIIAITEPHAVVVNSDDCEVCDCDMAIDSCPVAAISFQ
jgi:ferredoxin